jgi:hypothetical protein
MRRGPRITELDITRFTEGDCHILAKVLHLRTLWPLCTFHRGDCEPDLHAFVCDGDTAIDVRGARPIDDLLCEWEDAAGFIEISELNWGKEIFPGSRRRAHTIAPLLIPAGAMRVP